GALVFDHFLAAVVVDIQDITGGAATDKIIIPDLLHGTRQPGKRFWNIEVFKARHDLLALVEMEFDDPRIGPVGHQAIVEDQQGLVTIGERRIVLAEKYLVGRQREIAVLAAEMPHDGAGFAVDLDDLVLVPHGADQISVGRVDDHRIHVNIVSGQSSVTEIIAFHTGGIKGSIRGGVPAPDDDTIADLLDHGRHDRDVGGGRKPGWNIPRMLPVPDQRDVVV